MEAVACVRKYFVAASVERGLELLTISGIKARRFISSPIHMMNRLEASMVIMGPMRIVE